MTRMLKKKVFAAALAAALILSFVPILPGSGIHAATKSSTSPKKVKVSVVDRQYFAVHSKKGKLVSSEKDRLSYDKAGRLISRKCTGGKIYTYAVDYTLKYRTDKIICRAIDRHQGPEIPTDVSTAYFKDGHVAKIRYNSEGNISWQQVVYDGSGKPKEIKDPSTYEEDGNKVTEDLVYTYSYDPSGRVSSVRYDEITSSGSILWSTIRFSYDRRGYISRTVVKNYNEKGKLRSREVTSYTNHYDKQGRLVKINYRYKGMKSKFSFSYHYKKIKVTPEQKKFIKEQQDELLFHPTWSIADSNFGSCCGIGYQGEFAVII
ncbi:MAG: hypothetical protein ACOYJJ_07210 [Anaerovoracaceae bacterium]|jgi:YD repeat-containing protein